ncbi:P-loop containing nucleoside triphosphate hydrolase protein [Microthyrium microscopicum]|uniref:P-loop containing nucleoside triphosphate hydrolase protein n=1 Tax=Microthyrium microscopicum TaxID=703497 RepID=A0A6A6TYS3_9PEZI|nr:P-loop containing nucleoside triphosphate hydrolase protein [Microthyrium microscopicum]
MSKASRTQSVDSSAKSQQPKWKALFNFTTRKHLPFLILAVISSAAAGAAVPLNSYLIGKVFGAFTSFAAGQIEKDAFKHNIATYNIYIVIIAASNWLFASFAFFLWHTFGDLQARSARERLFNALLVRQVEWFDRRRDGVGALTTRILGYIQELRTATSHPLNLTTQYLGTTIGSFILAFYLSWKLTLVIIAGIPLIIVLVPVFSARVQPNITAQASKLSEASKHTGNAIGSIETVKCCNGEAYELRNYTDALRAAAVFFNRQVAWNALQNSIIRFLSLTMFVQGFWFGTILLDKGQISAAEIVSAFWGASLAVQSLMQVMPQLVMLEKGKAAGHRLRAAMAYMELNASDIDPNVAKQPEICAGDITFKQVSFAYPSRASQPVLRNVDMFFAAGETTFVVGKSGSGKSTIGQLLLKFYKPSSGDIDLDGNSILPVDPAWLRRKILLVEQQSTLFATSIRENIALGRYPQRSDAFEVFDAAKFAKVKEAIDDLPNGFKTRLTSKGQSLSGGQRQRVAIARAFIRDPPILILDESTSALDSINRTQVLEAIRRWRKGKTTLIIAHDITQIEEEDFVYVMRDGKVVQEGFRKAIEVIEGGAFHDLLSSLDEEEDDMPNLPGEPDPQIDAFEEFRLNSQRHTSTFDDLFDLYLDEETDPKSPYIPTVFGGGQSTRKAIIELDDEDDAGSLTESEDSAKKILDRVRDITTMKPMARRASLYLEQIVTRKSDRRSRLLSNFEEFEIDALPKPKRRRKKKKNIAESGISVALGMREIIYSIWPQFSGRERWYILVATVSCIIIAVSTPLFSFVLAKLLSTFSVPEGRKTKAAHYSLAILGIAVVDTISTFLLNMGMFGAGQLWANKLRIQALGSVLAQPREFFDDEKNSASNISETLDNHGESMQRVVNVFLGSVLSVTVMCSTAIIWSLVTCWKLTLVLLACSPIIWAISHAMQTVSGKLDEQYASAAEKSGSIFTETFTSIKTVRSLTLENYFRNKHQEASQNVLSIGIQRAVYCGVIFGLSESTVTFLTALIFYYGGVLLVSGDFSLSQIFQVFALLLFSVSNSAMIMASLPQMSVSRDAANRVLRLAYLPHESHEKSGTAQPTSVGNIELHNVSFAYPSRPLAQVLKNISLTIPQGHCVALVGLSGSGKSTITNLLLKLYPTANISTDDTDNTITLAHQPLSDIHTPHLRTLISIVSQTPIIFPATVAANIAYGLPASSPLASISSITAAATAAGAHEFIVSLPHGYDTLLGDGGTGLSGGQAQRIAVARALVRQPQVLVLDEATSALDNESAAQIRDTLRRLLSADRAGEKRRLTVLIVTHSKEMMRVADWVCMMERGRIVEMGEWDELISQQGRFAELVRGRAFEKDEARVRRRSMLAMSKVGGIVPNWEMGG